MGARTNRRWTVMRLLMLMASISRVIVQVTVMPAKIRNNTERGISAVGFVPEKSRARGVNESGLREKRTALPSENRQVSPESHGRSKRVK